MSRMKKNTENLEGLLFRLILPEVSIGLFGLGEIIAGYEEVKKEEWIQADLRWSQVMPSLRD